jgi:hypothetical protein
MNIVEMESSFVIQVIKFWPSPSSTQPTLCTGGGVYVSFSICSAGRYIRRTKKNIPSGAGSH